MTVPRIPVVTQETDLFRASLTTVSNIYKYYIAYTLIADQNARRAATKQAPVK